MKSPQKVNLFANKNVLGQVDLSVDYYDGPASFIWQYCRYNSAKWETVFQSQVNCFQVVLGPHLYFGDKYRCLICKVNSKKVIAYTSSYIVSDDEEQNRFMDAGNNQIKQNNYGHSIEETDGMDGLSFEIFCKEILQGNGFTNVKVTNGSGDYGVDILASKDNVTYGIQCKCYDGPVGNKAVQEVYSGKSYYNCMVAAILTNNYFTRAAVETAERNLVLLWNRDDLKRMIDQWNTINKD